MYDSKPQVVLPSRSTITLDTVECTVGGSIDISDTVAQVWIVFGDNLPT